MSGKCVHNAGMQPTPFLENSLLGLTRCSPPEGAAGEEAVIAL